MELFQKHFVQRVERPGHKLRDRSIDGLSVRSLTRACHSMVTLRNQINVQRHTPHDYLC